MGKWFKVTATVVVDVEIDLQAESEDGAERKFRDGLILNAALVDVPGADDAIVNLDSIAEIEVDGVVECHVEEKGAEQ